ncbi:MAG: zinc-ribbon and DUF3426 domain-containing protein [Burkholderiales bacterium]
MNLYTRCPGCQTVFRVTTRELQASNGRVRCGQCQELFDAFASLTANEPEGETPPPAAVHAAQTSSAAAGRTGSQPATQAASPPRPLRPDPAASLYEWEFRMPPQRSRPWLWAMLSFVLLFAALAQAAAAFRDEVLVQLPQTRPLYESACEWIGCQVGLPRLADRLHVEASDLRLLSSASPNQIELTVLLRNRAPVAIQYPAFELTLTNVQDQVLARRMFLPAEYLGDPGVRQAGLAGSSELPIRLFLDTGKITATGYRLYFFYP